MESEQGLWALRPDWGSGEGCGLACRPEGRQGSQEVQAEGARTTGEGTQAGTAREHVQGRNQAPPPVFVRHGHSMSVWGGLRNLWRPRRGHSRAGSVAKAEVTGKVRTKGGRGTHDPARDLRGRGVGCRSHSHPCPAPGRHPPPHGHVDDDQHEQGERGHATAHDERHRRQSRLLHVLWGPGKDRRE